MTARTAYGLSRLGEDWRANSACRDVDPELFFPVGEAEDGPAKAVCDRCPVRRQCLNRAIEAGEAFGVWGGTNPRERKKIRERRVAEKRRRSIIDRWAEYHDSGLTTVEIARKLELAPTTLYTTLDRARRAGDPRVPAAARKARAAA